MKYVSLIALSLYLTACATTHETTTLDRELALKLADRPTVVMQASPPVVINVNNGTSPQSQQAPTAPPATSTVSEYATEDGTRMIADDRTNCMNSPEYNINGVLTGYRRMCFGSK